MTVIALCPPQFAPQASEVDLLKGNWIEKYDGAHVCIARFTGCENRSLRHGKASDAFWCVIGNVFQPERCRNVDPFGRSPTVSECCDVTAEASWGTFATVAYDRIGGNFVVFADPKGYRRIRYRINEAGHLQIVYRNPADESAEALSRPMGRFRRNARLDIERLNFERLPEAAVLMFRDGEVTVRRDFELGPASTLYAHLTTSAFSRG
ncbi:hypothetical protein [Paraburkholderia caribensis]|uniref:hypothetical protein n=1 Tax=Paraburkholderia caribensis TaxID=75105 RepID=UPI001CC49E89|nr:hypothetical protein [Paraburkholderia caribensis]